MQSGGAERVMSVLCNGFAEKGVDVILGLTETDTNIAYKIDEKVKIVSLIQNSNVSVKKRIKSVKAIRDLYKQERPDVVVSFITRTNISAIIAAFGMHIPVIISERNNPVVDPKSKFTKLLRKMLYPLAKGCVFQTNYALDYFSNTIRRKSVVIANPVSEDVIKYRDNRIRKNRIIAVCRLEKQKRLSLLIEAFYKISSKHPNYTVDIFGVGSLHDELQNLINKYNLENKVFLRGYTSNAIEEMATSKIFVLCSDYEGMPNSLLEAMCVGCSCISTDSPAYGAREFLSGGENGELIPVGDLNSLCDALNRIIESDTLQEKYSHEAKKVYHSVAQKRIIACWLEYISSRIKLRGLDE